MSENSITKDTHFASTTGRREDAGKSFWILSPVADIALLTATPVAIVPLIYGCLWWFSPEVIALWVFALASLGHHMPGFLRAYGDRELFRRHRWQFLLGPVAALAITFYAFVWARSHSVTLLLLFWSTWHIMMQSYGFMRIYDAKRRRVSGMDANLDFAACIVVFAAGIVFSDARVAGIAETLLLAGLPIVSPSVLLAVKWCTGVLTAAVLGVLVFREVVPRRHAINWPKLLLLLSTALLYWASGRLAVNLLIGVAMFEVFHAIQYFAIVWFFNRNRVQRSRSTFGPLASMFAGNRWGLVAYLAVIAAFGLLGFAGRGAYAGSTTSIATALFAASAMLHFYYDGFIWKVRDNHTASHLNVAGKVSAKHPLLRHGLFGAGLMVVVLGLTQWEYHRSGGSPPGDAQLDALLSLAPDLPELQIRASRRELDRGDNATALKMAAGTARIRPESFVAQLTYGDAAAASNQWSVAESAYAAAAEIRPFDPEAQLKAGIAALQCRNYQAARNWFVRCLEHEPNNLQAEFQLGNVYYRLGDNAKALKHYRNCTRRQFSFTAAHHNIATILVETGDLDGASAAYRRVIRLKPADATAHYSLGIVLLEQNRLSQARRSILQAQRLGYKVENHILQELNSNGA